VSASRVESGLDAAAIRTRFREYGFIVDEPFATALQLMLALEKPLLVEGPSGVGKTESAKVLAEMLGTRLIRLQCYEGLDAMAALYEWNYPRQLLHARLTESDGTPLAEREAQIFSERFLLKRPLLEAITGERSPVLLIDEVDRADEAFEAFLLEVLAEWQVTIPELGTIRARHKPHVILTSNRTRELSDALRRRCLFLWIPYPSLEQEIDILHTRAPGLSERLASQIARFMQVVRALPLRKAPGVAESLDWAMALMSLHRDHLDAEALAQTLGCVLKIHEDCRVMDTHRSMLEPLLAEWPPARDTGGHRLETDFGFGSVSTPRR
jgi:MoxR-like ATPase